MTFLTQLNTLLDTYASKAEDDFNATESSWQNHKIAFTIDSYAHGRRVYTVNDIFYYLNYGTKVRHAGLSGDWVSKTKVRSLASGAGAGRVLFVSKKFRARGIEAREWDSLIQEKYQDEFAREMQKLAEESVKL